MKSENISKEFKNITNKKIRHLLKTKDLLKLTVIGIQEGFVENQTRIKAYEMLLDFKLQDKKNDYINFRNKVHDDSKNLSQTFLIEEDVKRSFFCLEEIEENILKENLNLLLKDFFLKHHYYQYFQGFNSIAKVFLMNYDFETAFCLLEIFADSFLKTCLIKTEINLYLEKKQKEILELVNKNSKVNFEPYHLGLFLNWLISFFAQSHSCQNIIFRIWDFLVCLKSIAIKENKMKEENFVELVVSSIITFFINAKSIDQFNLQNDFFSVLKGFDINSLEEFDFKIILGNTFRTFNNKLYF